ncbi:MAG: hypothetical protein C0490_16250 [Marivirga sp.]|nr:hypothetical protein [Marivirga sp.]
MAISKKNRRTIKYKGENFLWWVDNEFDGLGNMLSVNVASEDKKFLIKHFAIQKNPKESYLSVIGQSFPGLERKTGNSVKLSCPSFSASFVNNAVTSKTVKDILDWCFGADELRFSRDTTYDG